MSRQFFHLSLCLWVALGSVNAAAGDDDSRARELFSNGERLYREALYEEAASAWEEGYRLSDRPLFLFNIGNAYERMGDLEHALQALNRYRAFARADESDELAARIKNMQARYDEQRRAAARAETERAALQQRTDQIEQRAVLLEAERLEAERLEAERLAAVVTARSFPAGRVLMGTGGVLTLSGLVLGASALSRARSSVGTYCVSDRCLGEVQEPLGRSRTHALVGDVLGGVGVLTLVGGVFVQRTSDSRWVWTPQLGASGARLTLQGVFP